MTRDQLSTTNGQPGTGSLIPPADQGRRVLADLLVAIRDMDPSYLVNTVPDGLGPLYYQARNQLIYAALYLAGTLGYPAGITVADDLNWPVIMITLPTGQVSWHMPAYPDPWDGHTTKEKYDRITEYYLTA